MSVSRASKGPCAHARVIILLCCMSGYCKMIYFHRIENSKKDFAEAVSFGQSYSEMSSSLRPSKTAICFNIKLSTKCKVIWFLMHFK
jgi:hypothetical protein